MLYLYVHLQNTVQLKSYEQEIIGCALVQTVADLKLQRPGFNPMSVPVGFVMDTLALGHAFF